MQAGFKYWLCVIALLIFIGIQAIYAAYETSQTVDETYYNGSAYPMVRYNNYEFLGEHPPFLIQLGALPLLLLQPAFPIQNYVRLLGTNSVDISRTGAMFLYKVGNTPRQILFWERVPIILLTLLLAVGIFCLCGELFGAWGAFLSLALFSFDPNMIAHGSLYTTDMGLAVFYFFAIYASKRFFDEPSGRRAVWVGVACGAAFVSKISSLVLIPVIACLFVIYYFDTVKNSSLPPLPLQFEKWILGISLFLVANAIGEKQAMVLFGPFCVFAVYLFARDLAFIRSSSVARIFFRATMLGGALLCIVFSWKLKKKYSVSLAAFLMFGSFIALTIAAFFARFPSEDSRVRLVKCFLTVFVLAALFIVLDYTDIVYKFYRLIGFGNYMKPLGIVLSHSAGGHGACVEGSFVTCDWRYFPALMAIKTPFLTLILSVIGAIALLYSKRSILVKSLVLLPAIFFLGAAIPNKIHIGLRHILPVYPFLFLLAGYAGSLIKQIQHTVLRRCVFVLLAIFIVETAARTVAAAPDYLAFFNEFVGGAEQGAKFVADSNINWGQDNGRLAEFVIAKKIPMIKIASEAENGDVYNYYGMPWMRMEKNDFVSPRPGYYALGIRCYVEQQRSSESWFKNRPPEFRVGKTFFIFRVPVR
ncbi:MAG TPA: glycosyltransferase family 39 protein [Candidatus Omnitrophota bacterium]|nr:glycosyltransferase family 39 protein [Candidatus Omnitrophota bacterium]